MKNIKLLNEQELCEEFTRIFDSRRPIEIKDLCEILKKGEITEEYSEIGNLNNIYSIEYGKSKPHTHSLKVVEIVDYDDENGDFIIKGYVIKRG